MDLIVGERFSSLERDGVLLCVANDQLDDVIEALTKAKAILAERGAPALDLSAAAELAALGFSTLPDPVEMTIPHEWQAPRYISFGIDVSVGEDKTVFYNIYQGTGKLITDNVAFNDGEDAS